MAQDPRQFRPVDLCRLLNSTPLGEVIKQRQMQEHRVQAGLHIGSQSHVDLFKYVAWLVQERHLRAAPEKQAPSSLDFTALALDAAHAIVGSDKSARLTAKQANLLAALLTERTVTAAAKKAGVSRMTATRYLQSPLFQQAYQRARQLPVNTAIGRLQLGTGHAVDALLSIVVHGHRDSDRLRAAGLILEQSYRGLSEQALLTPPLEEKEQSQVGTSEVAKLLGKQLRQLEQASLSSPEKSRLMVQVSDALLRALTTDVIEKRLEAVQSVLIQRKKRS